MQLKGEEHEARNEVVDLAAHWPVRTPAAGFDLVEGSQVRSASNNAPPLFFSDFYLVARGAQSVEVKISPSIYQDFFGLRPTGNDIKRFADKFGLLGAAPRHFHRKSDMNAESGEPLRLWIRELTRFQRVFELWETSRQDRPFRVEAVLKEFGALWPEDKRSGLHTAGLEFPPSWSVDNPIDYARRTVINTINSALGSSGGILLRCGLPECGNVDDTENRFDITRAALQEQPRRRGSAGGSRPAIALTTLAGSLRKILWLQLACYVADMRKTKKCQALDCKLGGWIDVTDCARPGKLKYHPQCKERRKKQRRKGGN